MNDVSSWMSPDALQAYDQLIQETDMLANGRGKGGDDAEVGGGKGNAGKFAKRGKPWGGVAKRVGGANGGSAKHAHGLGPRQLTQQLKKQQFNEILGDIAGSKLFFMSLGRAPSLVMPQGLTHLTDVIKECSRAKSTMIVRAWP